MALDFTRIANIYFPFMDLDVFAIIGYDAQAIPMGTAGALGETLRFNTFK